MFDLERSDATRPVEAAVTGKGVVHGDRWPQPAMRLIRGAIVEL